MKPGYDERLLEMDAIVSVGGFIELIRTWQIPTDGGRVLHVDRHRYNHQLLLAGAVPCLRAFGQSGGA